MDSKAKKCINSSQDISNQNKAHSRSSFKKSNRKSSVEWKWNTTSNLADIQPKASEIFQKELKFPSFGAFVCVFHVYDQNDCIDLKERTTYIYNHCALLPSTLTGSPTQDRLYGATLELMTMLLEWLYPSEISRISTWLFVLKRTLKKNFSRWGKTGRKEQSVEERPPFTHIVLSHNFSKGISTVMRQDYKEDESANERANESLRGTWHSAIAVMDHQ